MTVLRTPVEDRFDAKVERTEACWIWRARLDAYGYGRIADMEGKMQPAHRVSYERFIGPIPDGLQIDHLCRNRGCVNPAHLEAVTQAENIRRGMAPTMVLHRSGKCKRGHDLTPENVYRRRSNGKIVNCKICANERRRNTVRCSRCRRVSANCRCGE